MKSVVVAYLFWLFGLHRFYLGRPATGLMYLMTCGGFGLWMVADFLLIPAMVSEENRNFAEMFRQWPVVVNVESRRRRRRD